MVLLCVRVFSARIIDMSISTFRTMIMVKGKKLISAILAFFEVLIWFYAARSALTSPIASIYVAISYSLGYATGSYIGMILSEKFIKGVIGVQIIMKNCPRELINEIKRNNFGLSEIKLYGNNKRMLFIQTNSQNFEKLKAIIHKYDKNSFIIINDTKYVLNGFIK